MCAGQWLGKGTKQGMQSAALSHHVPTDQTDETQETVAFLPAKTPRRQTAVIQTDR